MAWSVGQFLIATTTDAAQSVSAAVFRAALGLKELATLNPPVPISKGGTGATDAATALSSLGAASNSHGATHTNGTDDIQSATAAQKGLATAAQISKLDDIEAEADKTDATNVAAAGAVMESDMTTALMGFVIDEDDMASDIDTKVPTQQSVKAYVDASAGSGNSNDAMAFSYMGL